MIQGLYIISPSGLPLYSYNGNNSGGTFDTDILFSGLIMAVKKFLMEIDVGEVKHFTTESHQVQIFSEPQYVLVFIYDHRKDLTPDSLKKLFDIIVNEIGDSLETIDVVQIDNELSGLLSVSISRSIEVWKRSLNESAPSRKIRESFW